LSIAAPPPPGSATESLSKVPFGEFLLLLRRNGFAVGLRHYARLMTVLERLGPDCEPGHLKTVMAPMFATTSDQQDRFYRLFDQWFPILTEVARETPVALPRAAVVGDAETAPPPVHPPPKQRRSYLVPAAIGAAVVLALLSLQLKVSQSPTPQIDSAAPSIEAPTAPTTALPVPDRIAAPASRSEQPTPPQPPATDLRPLLTGPVAQLAGILLILVGFVAFEWRTYSRRRIIIERQRRERPPLVWPIRVETVANPLAESSEFYTAARRLRERQTGERSRLDIEATITATIRALGFPSLQYVLETRPPEYLVLIERSSVRDHQSKLYQHLVENLAAEGVHVTVYCYDDDPRICEPIGGGQAAMLSELRRRYATHRVLLFGTGDGLIDPITGRRKTWLADALSWPDRAVLTPEPVEMWGAREVALGSHLVVLPATINGLQAAIDHFQMPTRQAVAGIRRSRRTEALEIPELSGGDHVRLLRRYAGERGLQWVCACAVYPELQWNLTLHLGMLPELGDRAIDDELLLKLVRLPWFRTGVIPDDARAVLLRVVRPEVERAARGALITLLERNPAPAETIASSRYELDLLVQKLALHGRDRARRRELMRVAQRMPRDRVIRELAVLRLTEHDPASRLAMRLPGRLRHVFFQGGAPVFGLTTGARSLVAMALVGSVLFAGRVGAPEEDSTIAAQRGDSVAVPIALAGATKEPAPSGRDTVTRDSAVVAVRPAISAELDRLRDHASIETASVKSRGQDSVSIRAVDIAPMAVRTPDSVSIRIGSQTSDAALYVNSILDAPIADPRSVRLAAGVPVELSIRAAGCTSWDSTVVLEGGSTPTFGSKQLRCSERMRADSIATARSASQLQEAINRTRSQLAGAWRYVDHVTIAGVRVEMGGGTETNFRSPMSLYTVTGTVAEMGGTCGVNQFCQTRLSTPAPLSDSATISGLIRFEWRDNFGVRRRNQSGFTVVFVREGESWTLKRVVLRAL
jgi:hypothetical protein